MPNSRSRKKPKVAAQPARKVHTAAYLELQVHQRITAAYQKLMLQISRRTTTISGLVSKTKTTGYRATDFEAIALNFRKIAELIIYANLAGHKDEYDAKHPPEKQDWSIKVLIKRIKSINPRYYPNPSKREYKDEFGIYKHVRPADGDWMTEDDLIDMYDRCAKLLHAEKDSDPKADLDEYLPLFIEWGKKLFNLLSEHFILLPDGKHSVWCNMNPKGWNGMPQAVICEEISKQDAYQEAAIAMKKENNVA